MPLVEVYFFTRDAEGRSHREFVSSLSSPIDGMKQGTHFQQWLDQAITIAGIREEQAKATAPTPPEGRMPPLAHEQNDSVDNGRVDGSTQKERDSK